MCIRDRYGQPYEQYAQQPYEYVQYDAYGRPVDAYGQPLEGYEARPTRAEAPRQAPRQAPQTKPSRSEAPRAPRVQGLQPGQTYESFAQPTYDGYAYAASSSRKGSIPAAHQVSDNSFHVPMLPKTQSRASGSPQRAQLGMKPQSASNTTQPPQPTAGSVGSVPSASGRHRRQNSAPKRGGRWAALLNNDPLTVAKKSY